MSLKPEVQVDQRALTTLMWILLRNRFDGDTSRMAAGLLSGEIADIAGTSIVPVGINQFIETRGVDRVANVRDLTTSEIDAVWAMVGNNVVAAEVLGEVQAEKANVETIADKVMGMLKSGPITVDARVEEASNQNIAAMLGLDARRMRVQEIEVKRRWMGLKKESKPGMFCVGAVRLIPIDARPLRSVASMELSQSDVDFLVEVGLVKSKEEAASLTYEQYQELVAQVQAAVVVDENPMVIDILGKKKNLKSFNLDGLRGMSKKEMAAIGVLSGALTAGVAPLISGVGVTLLPMALAAALLLDPLLVQIDEGVVCDRFGSVEGLSVFVREQIRQFNANAQAAERSMIQVLNLAQVAEVMAVKLNKVKSSRAAEWSSFQQEVVDISMATLEGAVKMIRNEYTELVRFCEFVEKRYGVSPLMAQELVAIGQGVHATFTGLERRGESVKIGNDRDLHRNLRG